jgi:hypothetical protein
VVPSLVGRTDDRLKRNAGRDHVEDSARARRNDATVSLHLLSSIEVIAESAEEMRLRTRVIISRTQQAGSALAERHGTYFDVVRRVGREWRFTERVIRLDPAVIAARQPGRHDVRDRLPESLCTCGIVSRSLGGTWAANFSHTSTVRWRKSTGLRASARAHSETRGALFWCSVSATRRSAAVLASRTSVRASAPA